MSNLSQNLERVFKALNVRIEDLVEENERLKKTVEERDRELVWYRERVATLIDIIVQRTRRWR